VEPLAVFSPKTRAWFEEAFGAPTPAQTLGWPAIANGRDTLIQAPTGSGKTLAAFLYGIDKLNSEPGEGLRLIYVSPLKALNYDIERNLRGPLAGLDFSEAVLRDLISATRVEQHGRQDRRADADAALAGGVVILDTTIEEVMKDGADYRVRTRDAAGRELTISADDVIAATGFVTPLRDLAVLGVATFGQSRLPAQTPFWESATVPGIFFAGTITQGAAGLKKHGIPSNSGAVQGHRYNARVLARHLAETRFGVATIRMSTDAAALVPYLLDQVSNGPELWHQRGYLARVINLDRDIGITNEGIIPLQYFLDSGGGDAIAATLESNGQGNPYPVMYLRRGGSVAEHPLPPHPLLDFTGPDYQGELRAILQPVLSAAGSPA